MRDELILALDLYMREGRNAPVKSLDELSGLLRSMPVENHLTSSPQFRNRNSVSLKLYNFHALDPAASNRGLTRGGRRDAEVWEDFAERREALVATAAAIRANIATIESTDAEAEEPEVEEASEGRILTRVHRVRERSSRLVTRRKERAIADTGTVACEACGFNFGRTYGAHGEGFAECHHTVPLAHLEPGTATRSSDLALLCANCHRMIHRRRPWLTMAELRRLIQEGPQAPR